MSRKTQITQQNIGSAIDSQTIFNSQTPGRVPVVLVPAGRWCCSCYYTVPSGVSCITQKFGRDCDPMLNDVQQLTDPGLKCSPAWTQVKYCVTKQACTYEAPVKSCPTVDNVMVDCELTLVFQIGPDPQEVRNFVYKLGAPRFNEFLSAAVDEGIRQLVRGEKLENVLELRGSSQEGVRKVMNSLNTKFSPFGVKFTRAVIKEVRLGNMLEGLLEKTTNFKTKIRDCEKEHEVEMKKINYDYEKRRAELDKLYELKIQDLENDMDVALRDRKKLKVVAESKKEVNIVKAEEDKETAKKQAQANLDVVKLEAKKENAAVLAEVQARCAALQVAAKRDAQVRVQESEALVDVAKKNAEALVTEAKAEGVAAKQLKTVREWELAMAKLEVSEAMARKSKIVIAGNVGDRLLGSFVSEDIIGNISLKM